MHALGYARPSMTSSESASFSTGPSAFDVLPEWTGADDDIFHDFDPFEQPRGLMRQTLEWGAVVIGALIAALVIKTFLFQAFYIPSESMLPTLEIGDRVLVNKVSYDFGDISRGDVIVFTRPPNAPPSEVNDFIKRVVGVPGDELQGIDGMVYVNGELISEPYIMLGDRTDNLPLTIVPAGHVFVMGDNRSNSTDSRIFGAVGQQLIVGKAFLRVWPISNIGGL